VVVDNASTDETREVASDAGLEVISLELNRGLGTAFNEGVPKTVGPRFALLNPDVRATSAADSPRLEEALADGRVGAVAPVLVLPDGTVQDSVRRVPTRSICWSAGSREMTAVRYARRAPWTSRGRWPRVFWFAVEPSIRLAASTRATFYFEDVDLCVRLRAAGFRVRCDPTVRLRHDYRAASRARVRTPATRHHIRSALRFLRRKPAAILPRRRRLADMNSRRR
jgi:N-acetylglucosaminyl-diphospho-decaprenol L-rhamnosyltransferase